MGPVCLAPDSGGCLSSGQQAFSMAATGEGWRPLLCLIFIATLPVRSSVTAVKVTEGEAAILTCQYSVKRFGVSHVCWGRGCGTFWCNDILLQTDENGMISKVSDRYRLTGDALAGRLDLLILQAQRTDSGLYCCRVDIDGIFNDKKVTHSLRVVKAPAVSIQPTTTTEETTEPPLPTEHWAVAESPYVDVHRRNSSVLVHSGTVLEDVVPALSLQINVPVLSLSLSLLLLLLGALALLAFKRGIHLRSLKTGCLSAKEPPHIIYEIRMRRPVEENIYTLD
ncbi:T-cell immunoglobulin and mucin domain-containing protein 4 [Osmerus eperlanus]|uniref:T-cell immunoglobulin and mucin domain-containing protein 4 n=1 Tax=Osmerus eperlanus TaxID=29151 RepID=UPI002E0E6E19